MISLIIVTIKTIPFVLAFSILREISSVLHVVPEGLSLDIVNRVMYWTDLLTYEIQRASMDGQDQTVIATLVSDSMSSMKPRDIVADPVNG